MDSRLFIIANQRKDYTIAAIYIDKYSGQVRLIPGATREAASASLERRRRLSRDMLQRSARSRASSTASSSSGFHSECGSESPVRRAVRGRRNSSWAGRPRARRGSSISGKPGSGPGQPDTGGGQSDPGQAGAATAAAHCGPTDGPGPGRNRWATLAIMVRAARRAGGGPSLLLLNRGGGQELAWRKLRVRMAVE